VPDISALGDPAYGYAVYAGGQWIQVGGTSAAAPVWASIAALTDASAFCSAYRSKGAFLPQTLYAVAGAYHRYIYASSPQGLNDITSGNNDYTPSGYTGGLYPATKGYDMATGLGAPMVSGLSGVYGSGHGLWYTFLTGLTQLLCHQSATTAKTVKVTSVSPNAGPAGKATKVVVHGSGFLPISSADEAQVISGGKVLATVAASCRATACTLTVPAEATRTIDIKIFASSLWSSPLTTRDRYRYVKAPHISSVSPARGTHGGGTTITIRGTNFIGVKSVRFGRTAGTKVRLVSATEITVVTPRVAAKGTVKLTIVAAGGTSNAATYTYT
jgi:subtilase family serine protease